MLQVILWYLLLVFLGFLGYPVVHRVFPALADRGYSFSKALALLGWGFVFWLLGSFGFLGINAGSALAALLIFAGIAFVAGRKTGWQELLEWIRSEWRTILTVELVFLVFFAFMALVRGANPMVSHTEQPMELAFINAILRSDGMPPNDPWLSGYSISYYHFGYILVALMALLTNTVGGVAFNLGLVTTFSLSAVGAFGVLYNLLKAYLPKLWGGLVFGVLGPIFVLLISNVEAFLELLHARGWFWTEGADGRLTSSFWSWLNVEDLMNAPNLPVEGGMRGGWWWWRASRVINDHNLAGADQEVIHEFPAFSYVLGDLHPHVLNMPFVFLAIAFALNLILGGAPGITKIWKLRFYIKPTYLLIAAWMIGSMGFLNTWDFPMYVGLFCGTYALILARKDGWNWGVLRDFILLGLLMGILGGIYYLPFYLSFSSQAGGFLPNMINPSPGKQIWIVFGTLWIPLFIYLVWKWIKTEDKKPLLKSLAISFGAVLALYLAALLYTLFIVGVVPLLSGLNPDAANAGNALLNHNGAENISQLVSASISLRFENPGGWITLGLLLALALQPLLKSKADEAEEPEPVVQQNQKSVDAFVLWMIILGAALVLVPEFIYLKDNFGTRMNTIFKFYYQAWALWSIVAAFASVVLLIKLPDWLKPAYLIVFVGIFLAGIVYPVYGFTDRTNDFTPAEEWNWNGSLPNYALSEDDQAAVAWLWDAPLGVIAESSSHSSSYGIQWANIATHSGMPTLIGWSGHESQWRGGETEKGSRMDDVARIYTASTDQELIDLLDMYNVRYVYLGTHERSTYQGINDSMLARVMTPVFQQGTVTIYEYAQP